MGKWQKRGEKTAPSSPVAIALASPIAKAQQLGRIQAACLVGKLSWAAYYTELANLRLLLLKCEDEIKEIYK